MPEQAKTPARVGFYICHCGHNIAGIVDVEAVAKYAAGLPDVAVSREYKYMCSDPGQELLRRDIAEHGLNRVVVAACSPHLHEKTFRGALESAGLNPYLFQMVNAREHVSWVSKNKEINTQKVKALVSAAVARVKRQEPLKPMPVKVNPNTLVVGGVTAARLSKSTAERAPACSGWRATGVLWVCWQCSS